MGYGSDELYTCWAARSLRAWQELFRECKQALFLNTGVLWLSTASDAYTKLIPLTFAAHGILHEKLSTNELSARFPEIETEDVDFGIFEPQSGVLFARRAVQAVLEEALRTGAQYKIEAVVPPSQDQSRLNSITTRSGNQITGDVFVFACGAWLPHLFPELFGARIFPTRQEVFYFGAPPGSRQFRAPLMPVWLDHAEDMYGLPDIENRGIKVASDRHGEPFDPDSGRRCATAAGERAVRDYLKRRLPQLIDPPLIETRVCQYENTSNGDFLIDCHPEMKNMWFVGGGSGHGFKHGPAVGKHVASVLLDSIRQDDRFSIRRKLQVQHRSVY
jgi:sarcosine oxidase